MYEKAFRKIRDEKLEFVFNFDSNFYRKRTFSSVLKINKQKNVFSWGWEGVQLIFLKLFGGLGSLDKSRP